MPNKDPDYYEVLGVPRDADEKTIKDAYHRLAMKWHPDRNASPEAEGRFKEIATAYAILSDPKKRARYDARGFEGVAHYNQDDLFRDIDLGSLFGDLGFGFGPGGESIFERFFHGGGAREARGEDIRVNIEVPLSLVAAGGSHPLNFGRRTVCPACRGYGTADGEPSPACAECGGSGHKVTSRDRREEGGGTIRFQQLSVCPVCHGTGTAVGASCARCGGTGEVLHPERLKLHIPPGIEEGMTLRIAGHGMPAPSPSGQPGNLYVNVFSAPDPRFQRRGADLWRSEPIALDEAVLGCRRIVPTLDGEVSVTVPPGIQPDEVLRVRGKGLPRYGGDGRGDLNLRIQISVPQRLSEEERVLFERLREIRRGGR